MSTWNLFNNKIARTLWLDTQSIIFLESLFQRQHTVSQVHTAIWYRQGQREAPMTRPLSRRHIYVQLNFNTALHGTRTDLKETWLILFQLSPFDIGDIVIVLRWRFWKIYFSLRYILIKAYLVWKLLQNYVLCEKHNFSDWMFSTEERVNTNWPG